MTMQPNAITEKNVTTDSEAMPELVLTDSDTSLDWTPAADEAVALKGFKVVCVDVVNIPTFLLCH